MLLHPYSCKVFLVLAEALLVAQPCPLKRITSFLSEALFQAASGMRKVLVNWLRAGHPLP